MARRTKEEAAETRESILDAAIDMFYDIGVQKTSLQKVADRAGVTRGAVYWHFDNKLDLFKAIYDRFYTSAAEELVANLGVVEANPLEKIKDFAVQFLQSLATDEQHRKMITLFYLKCDYSGEMASILEHQGARKRDNLDILAQYFERAQKNGQLSANANPEHMAQAWASYVIGLMYDFLRNRTAQELATEADSLMTIFMQGLVNQ